MKNPQPNKTFLTTDVLRSILNDDTVKENNCKVVFVNYPVCHDELAVEIIRKVDDWRIKNEKNKIQSMG